MQTVRAADTNEVDKLIFQESDNDRKVSRRRVSSR
ncbi:Type I inositol 1,4,5-trisphosphate 5-phosphatase [Liparis tanakae]|uniref:Type I inositol 1,4,5-trisphosphate 5-phosphatase n=1 Tax=Liparis tanakae TaxID=230148 RepID=A0A4Z2E1U8_9TELE|nr:Type I inositol 1,4,5-trisphosphate 5-phosphatase [Liparis tanakae]